MCTVCGCGPGETRIEGVAPHADHRHGHGHGHDHVHGHEHEHVAPDGTVTRHSHDHGNARLIRVEQDILAKNDRFAAVNRQLFTATGTFVVNLMSSPGSGKTTLLTRTLADLRATLPMAVIEGDQQTSFDAERIRETGAPAIQVNTGKGCHLDAQMVTQALGEMPAPANGVLFIENVGNLVCPAGFDLGETARAVVISVTEGEDKPLKYPDMFATADLVVINKIDLLPYVSFSVPKLIDFIHRVRPGMQIIQVSSTTGAGSADWYAWIAAGSAAARQRG
jgi:hydrogenase nickel incorporation protein HypB